MRLLRLRTCALVGAAVAASVLTGVAAEAPEVTHPAGPTANEYVATLFVFMLATFVGLDVIRRVSRLLHTPLMSLTNAISAISLVGAILVLGEQTGPDQNLLIVALATIAVAAAMTNVVSGFLITDRMLKMFKRKENGK